MPKKPDDDTKDPRSSPPTPSSSTTRRWKNSALPVSASIGSRSRCLTRASLSRAQGQRHRLYQRQGGGRRQGHRGFCHERIEPEVTGAPKLGYDEVLHPDWFESHAGLDESGKGDFFGPVVAATVIAEGEAVRAWLKAGVRDSKTIVEPRF